MNLFGRNNSKKNNNNNKAPSDNKDADSSSSSSSSSPRAPPMEAFHPEPAVVQFEDENDSVASDLDDFKDVELADYVNEMSKKFEEEDRRRAAKRFMYGSAGFAVIAAIGLIIVGIATASSGSSTSATKTNGLVLPNLPTVAPSSLSYPSVTPSTAFPSAASSSITLSSSYPSAAPSSIPSLEPSRSDTPSGYPSEFLFPTAVPTP